MSILWTLLQATAAHAQTAPGGQPPMLMSFMPIVFMIVVMYFLVIRPQARKQKAHQEFLNGLKRGEDVVTSAGIIGTVEGLSEQFVILKVEDGVRIRVLKSRVEGPWKAAEARA